MGGKKSGKGKSGKGKSGKGKRGKGKGKGKKSGKYAKAYQNRVNWVQFVKSKDGRATAEALDLLDQVLVYDFNERLTAREAMEHPYFDKVRKRLGGQWDHKIDILTKPSRRSPAQVRQLARQRRRGKKGKDQDDESSSS